MYYCIPGCTISRLTSGKNGGISTGGSSVVSFSFLIGAKPPFRHSSCFCLMFILFILMSTPFLLPSSYSEESRSTSSILVSLSDWLSNCASNSWDTWRWIWKNRRFTNVWLYINCKYACQFDGLGNFEIWRYNNTSCKPNKTSGWSQFQICNCIARKLFRPFQTFLFYSEDGLSNFSSACNFGREQLYRKAMLKFSSKNIEKCSGKSKKGAILVFLDWSVLEISLSQLVLILQLLFETIA